MPTAAAAVGRVAAEGGVGDRQRARVVDAAAAAAADASAAGGRVAAEGGVGDRQRARVVDAAAAPPPPKAPPRPSCR